MPAYSAVCVGSFLLRVLDAHNSMLEDGSDSRERSGELSGRSNVRSSFEMHAAKLTLLGKTSLCAFGMHVV
jgi:butyrate kinase